MKNRKGWLLISMLLWGAVAGAQPPAPQPVLPEALAWFGPPGNPALRGAWVIGAENAPGLYVLRVRLAKGGKIAPHTHPDDRHTTVLSGTLFLGFGPTVDEAAMVAVPAGGVYLAPAGMVHYVWAKDRDVVFQESGAGPTATVPLAR